jgi:hypothetical protein
MSLKKRVFSAIILKPKKPEETLIGTKLIFALCRHIISRRGERL